VTVDAEAAAVAAVAVTVTVQVTAGVDETAVAPPVLVSVKNEMV